VSPPLDYKASRNLVRSRAIICPGADLLSTPSLNYEQWRDMLRPNWGLYIADDPKSFAGRVRTRKISGFNVSDATMFACVSGLKEMFALMALTTTMPYSRLPDDQRSFRTTVRQRLTSAMSH
jgi:hypothetical protein